MLGLSKYTCKNGFLGNGVLLNDLTEPFKKCRSLNDKPKIFVCDVCRGSKEEPSYAKSFNNDLKATSLSKFDAPSSRSSTPYYSLKDFIFCYGSADGHVAGKQTFVKFVPELFFKQFFQKKAFAETLAHSLQVVYASLLMITCLNAHCIRFLKTLTKKWKLNIEDIRVPSQRIH